MIATVLVLVYCIIGGIFTWGITEEYKKDTSNDLDSFSPAFVKVCIVMASLGWPLLIVVDIWQKYKEKQ
jgi:TRAP-type C4-dicarboxylate transport system permease small subunit